MKLVLGWLFDFVRSPLGLLIILFAVFFGGFHFFSGVESVKTLLGFNTKENLEKQLKQSRENVSTLKEVNDGNKKAIEIAETAKEKSEEITIVKEKNDKKATQVKDKIQLEKDKKISEVDNSQVSEEDKDEAKSLVQITAIWKTYCAFNKDDLCTADMPYTPIVLASEGEIK